MKIYKKTHRSILLLKILALSGNEIKNRDYKPIKKSFSDIGNRIDNFKRSQRELQN